MAKMTIHQLTDGQMDVAENGENYLATVTPLDMVTGHKRVHVQNLIELGQWSEPCFIRLANGDLIVGRFPQEGTYETLSDIENDTRREHKS